jgi:hypothetical protein
MVDRIGGLDPFTGSRAGQIKETALDLSANAREWLGQGTGAIRKFTVEQPARALALALSMGVVLGWLTKRR